MKHFRPYEPEQMLLLPPSLRDWVAPDHEIYFISDIVDRMDLSAVLAAYDDPRGSPPYSPRMMVKVLFYAYARGVRSSRKIERMLWEDVPMRVLSGNQQPDFWTIAAFRRRHLKALGELFVQTVEMAKQAGMAQVGHVAIDGTKVKANASKHSATSYGRMGKERDRLRTEVERYLKEAERTDTQADKEPASTFGLDTGGCWRVGPPPGPRAQWLQVMAPTACLPAARRVPQADAARDRTSDVSCRRRSADAPERASPTVASERCGGGGG